MMPGDAEDHGRAMDRVVLAVLSSQIKLTVGQERDKKSENYLIVN